MRRPERRVGWTIGQLQALAESADEDLGGRVIVVDDTGAFWPTRTEGARGDYSSRPEIARALDGRASQGERRSNDLDEDLLFTAVLIVVEAARGRGGVTQSVDAVNTEVRNDVIALIGVGVVALLLGLGVAWLLAGSLASRCASCRERASGRKGRPRRARRGDRLHRAPGGGHGVQRHDRPPRPLADRPAGVRQRVAPACARRSPGCACGWRRRRPSRTSPR